MKGIKSFKLMSIILVLAYLLSACSGTAVQSGTPAGGRPQAMEVAFTGTVESVGTGQITVSGQIVAIDAKTIVDANIKVGDIVKVEAQVADNGAVTAVKVESFGADDSNTNSSNTNDAVATDDNTNANTNDNTNTTGDNANSNDNGSSVSTSADQEIVGKVDALSADSVTVDGVVYQFSSSTEFKDAIFAGDTVKLHVIVNADGSFTVREIEKSDDTSIGNDNSNDDNGNDDNSNGNSNDDDDDDNENDNSNGNSNSNSNDDD